LYRYRYLFSSCLSILHPIPSAVLPDLVANRFHASLNLPPSAGVSPQKTDLFVDVDVRERSVEIVGEILEDRISRIGRRLNLLVFQKMTVMLHRRMIPQNAGGRSNNRRNEHPIFL
jgi:hypothetical protein